MTRDLLKIKASFYRFELFLLRLLLVHFLSYDWQNLMRIPHDGRGLAKGSLLVSAHGEYFEKRGCIRGPTDGANLLVQIVLWAKDMNLKLLLDWASGLDLGNHASEETDNSYNADEAISYVPDESVELQRNTNDTAREDDHIKQMKETTEDDTTDVLEAAAKKTKETAKDAWEATKDTARKIKESVVGNSSFNIDDDVWEDHTGKPKIKGDDIIKP
ncbi:hypothetical protein Tco_0962142 [Tanacetum coccineum]